MLDACVSFYIGGLVATTVVSLLHWSRNVSIPSFLMAHLLWPLGVLWALCGVGERARD